MKLIQTNMRVTFMFFIAILALIVSVGCQQQDYNESEEITDNILYEDSSFIKVSEALHLLDTVVTVKGYVGGCIEGTSISKANFHPPFCKESNIFLTEKRNDSLPVNCFPIQLVNNSDNRKMLNLVSHPENYHQLKLIRGKLEKYFSRSGIKKITAYRFLKDTEETGDSINHNGPYIVTPF